MRRIVVDRSVVDTGVIDRDYRRACMRRRRRRWCAFFIGRRL
jgi:hypothetical protein